VAPSPSALLDDLGRTPAALAALRAVVARYEASGGDAPGPLVEALRVATFVALDAGDGAKAAFVAVVALEMMRIVGG
jgi:hypothetical protein